jgi:triosephosphate isomerase
VGAEFGSDTFHATEGKDSLLMSSHDMDALRPLVAGNWKMHGLAAQLHEVEAVAESVRAQPPSADVLICVPATLLSRAVTLAAGRIALGGQDCHAEVSGPFTGDISGEMLRDAGASAVIVGHSERRLHHHETDLIVAAKAAAAWRSTLFTIVCIGESEAQRRNGDAFAVSAEQLAGSLPSALAISGQVAIAYEPLWAIGSGSLPSANQIAEMHQHLRACLIGLVGTAGSAIRILYGGSVTGENAAEILSVANVNGVLIGGASLLATDFESVLRCVPDLRPAS